MLSITHLKNVLRTKLYEFKKVYFQKITLLWSITHLRNILRTKLCEFKKVYFQKITLLWSVTYLRNISRTKLCEFKKFYFFAQIKPLTHLLLYQRVACLPTTIISIYLIYLNFFGYYQMTTKTLYCQFRNYCVHLLLQKLRFWW